MKKSYVLCIVMLAFGSVSSAQVGDITFETSASEEAQAHFLRGVAILHSFGFEDAIDEFRKAQEIEPDFALAYWGEAMAYNNNPLSSPTRQDLPAARRALQKLAPSRAARIAKAKTEKEKMWMEAVDTLYGSGEKEARDWAYAEQMARIVERYPDDEEARAFYALGLLGTVRRAGDDFNQQMQAAAIAQALFRENPRHPGAAHYIIHAFDDPMHAPLALYAADRYAEIAPDVEHALHMPAHIFVQLGLWDKVVKSNKRAYEASVEWAKRRGLSDTKRDFHALAWMQFGYLQRGQLEEARNAVELIRPIAEREVTTTRIQATYANMRARYMLETETWDAYDIPVEALLSERHAGDVYLLLAAGMAAVENDDLAAAERIEARLDELQSADTAGLKSYLQGQVTLDDLKVSSAVAYRQVGAVLRAARGEYDEAIRLSAAAVEKEKEMHPAYGPPEPIVPTHELHARVLLRAGRTEDAAEQFQTMMARMPNRTQSIYGAAKALDALGDHEAARELYAKLGELWVDSEDTPRAMSVRKELAETSP